jgi:hypothetical protein
VAAEKTTSEPLSLRTPHRQPLRLGHSKQKLSGTKIFQNCSGAHAQSEECPQYLVVPGWEWRQIRPDFGLLILSSQLCSCCWYAVWHVGLPLLPVCNCHARCCGLRASSDLCSVSVGCTARRRNFVPTFIAQNSPLRQTPVRRPRA